MMPDYKNKIKLKAQDVASPDAASFFSSTRHLFPEAHLLPTHSPCLFQRVVQYLGCVEERERERGEGNTQGRWMIICPLMSG